MVAMVIQGEVLHFWVNWDKSYPGVSWTYQQISGLIKKTGGYTKFLAIFKVKVKSC